MKSDPERPISSVMSAMMHRIADGDTDMLARLREYVLDPDDTVADRWQYLRIAERRFTRTAPGQWGRSSDVLIFPLWNGSTARMDGQ